MTSPNKARPKRALDDAAAATTSATPTGATTPMTRTQTLTELMRGEGGATAAELAAAIGWQVHSVRGFISGTLKKRASLEVVTTKVDGLTRYQVRHRSL